MKKINLENIKKLNKTNVIVDKKESENVMTNLNQEAVVEAKTTEFNVFDYTKSRLIKAFAGNLGKKSFVVKFRRLHDTNFINKEGETIKYDGCLKVLNYLQKQGAFKFEYDAKPEQVIQEDGTIKHLYTIKITKFNPKAKTISAKTNKEYPIFFKELGEFAY